MGKAFEKQIKTIEDQGQKQIKAIQDQGQLKTIKKYAYDAEDTPFISKQKEIFNELEDERLEKITDLIEKVNSSDLIYRYKGNTPDWNFEKFDNIFGVIDKIGDGKIEFKSYLGEIKKWKKIKKIKRAKKHFV